MARRGGFRARRYIVPNRDASVWVSSGRWGPRRARVEQCQALTAELVYHEMVLKSTKAFGPGDGAILTWTPHGCPHPWRVTAEVVANAVWRRGRVFLRCGACGLRATRLYVPVAHAPPRCRRCWGLAYESQRWSYKPVGFLGPVFGPVAYAETDRKRQRRRVEALERYAQRRSFLRP